MPPVPRCWLPAKHNNKGPDDLPLAAGRVGQRASGQSPTRHFAGEPFWQAHCRPCLAPQAGGDSQVEVELHGNADRLRDKLVWYRNETGDAGVLWLTHRDTVLRPPEAALAHAGSRG